MYENIARLVQYGLNTGLIEPEDKIYATNLILSEMPSRKISEIAMV